MWWRSLLTLTAWFLGSFFQFWDGQVFRNAVVMLVAGLLGLTPWLPLLGRRRSTRERVAALAVVLLSVGVLALIASDIPRAYEFQRSFNERAGTRPASGN